MCKTLLYHDCDGDGDENVWKMVWPFEKLFSGGSSPNWKKFLGFFGEVAGWSQMYGSQTETFLVPFSNQAARDSSSLSFSCERREQLWLTSVLFLLQTVDRVSCVIAGADNHDKDAVEKQSADPSQWTKRKVCFSHGGNFFIKNGNAVHHWTKRHQNIPAGVNQLLA